MSFLAELLVSPQSYHADTACDHKNQHRRAEIAGKQRRACQRRGQNGRKSGNGGEDEKAQRSNVNQSCRPSQKVLWRSRDEKQQKGNPLKAPLIL